MKSQFIGIIFGKKIGPVERRTVIIYQGTKDNSFFTTLKLNKIH